MRFNKTVIGYLLASIAGFFTLSPWIVVFIKNSHNATQKTLWQSLRMPVLELIKNWALNITRQFLDVGLHSDLPRLYLILTLPVILMILIIVGYSFYFLLNQTPMRVWLFVVTLTSVTVAIFLPADLILGGIRSINTRYMIPCYLGMQISVAYLLAEKITSPTVKVQFQKLWRLALAALLSIGIISCCIYLPADTWWNKDRSYINIQIADMVNSASRPLVITDMWVYSVDKIGNLLGMSSRINSPAKFLVLPPKIIEIPDNFKEIFLYDISPTVKSEIEKNNRYTIQNIYPKTNQPMIFGKLVKK